MIREICASSGMVHYCPLGGYDLDHRGGRVDTDIESFLTPP
jgi:hypothetical protein